MFEFFKKMLKKLAGPTPRIYHFVLPYTIETIYLHYGIAQLKSAGVFQKLPKELQSKWQKSLDGWHPVKVTQEDLDKIEDEEWEIIASKLNLKWEYDIDENESENITGV